MIVSLAIFRFNEKDPHDFQIGLVRDDDGLLGLPSMQWYNTAPIEVTAKHLLSQSVHADEDWFDLEEVGNTEVPGSDTEYIEVLSVWRTYVPDNIDVNPKIEWIDYGKLETISSRVVRHHLKALRRAKNRG
jgi:hypothetical protein